MSLTHQSEFDASETGGEDYSSLVRVSYEKLFGSLLTPEKDCGTPEAVEQPS